ncbi:MAG: hypothetical protein ACI9FR_000202 [Cryomorphaceae bacterium]|jgi:hypothetical protein
MQIDRYMVNLFFEIRRNLPYAQRADLKIADSRIGNLMVDLHKSTDDQNIKVLIEAFLDRAGAQWTRKIKGRPSHLWSKRADQALPTEPSTSESKKAKSKADKKIRYYRGARVDQ